MKTVSDFKSSNTTFPQKSPLRIADILLDDAENDEAVLEHFLMDGSREACRSADCSLPRRIVGRWLSRLTRCRVKSEKGSEIKEEEREFGDRTVEARPSMNGFNGRDLAAATEGGLSGQHNKETSFNVGVGCCLLYLIAASQNELCKMMEIRMQMETLLQNARERLQKKDALSVPSEPNDVFSYSTTDAPEGTDSESQFFPQLPATSYDLPESSTVTVSDHSLKWEAPKKKECLEGMDQLEKELEAELELLQLHLDTDTLLAHPHERRIQDIVGDAASSKSRSMSSGEAIDPEGASTEMHCGIPPCELERRLHELLEARQQEKIRELEAALEHVKHKLWAKEIEVSWWKDAAGLISRHVPEPLPFTSRARPKNL